MPKPEASDESLQTTGTGCLVRMFWMFGGNIVLGICAIAISQKRGLQLGAADAIFWAAVVAIILLRHLDISRFQGTTATGAPATLRHWRRHTLLLLAAGLVVWLATHAWAYLAK